MFLESGETLNRKPQLNGIRSQPPGRAYYFGKLAFYGYCSIIVASCSFLAGPAYKRPEVPEKDTWHQTSGVKVSAAETIQPEWWKKFGDSYLDRLIQQAIEGGSDLKILAAQMEQAGAGIGVEKAARLPTLQNELDLGNKVSIGPGLDGGGNDGGDDDNNGGDDGVQVGFGLSWELDVWGKIQKKIKAQQAVYKASEAEWRAGYLTLVSSVANKYFQIRLFDEQIEQQSETLKANEQLMKIYNAQYKEGLMAESRLLSQQAEINSLRRDLLELQRQRQVAELNLSTLLGLPAGNLKVPPAPLTGTIKEVDVPVGLPSELLSRRPDIIQQEYRVVQAHELVGVARLERLPSISLSGNAGSSDILKSWTLGLANINIPIFNPSISANIRSSKASAKVAEENYKRTVITAFEEVETALTNLASRKKQKRQLEQQIENLSVVRNVQYAQLKEGLVSQLEVFDTDRTLLSAQQSMLQLHQQVLSDTVTLYKAMGGGWPTENIGQAVPSQK